MKQCLIKAPSAASLSRLGVKPLIGFPIQPRESQFKSSAVMSKTFGFPNSFDKTEGVKEVCQKVVDWKNIECILSFNNHKKTMEALNETS